MNTNLRKLKMINKIGVKFDTKIAYNKQNKTFENLNFSNNLTNTQTNAMIGLGILANQVSFGMRKELNMDEQKFLEFRNDYDKNFKSKIVNAEKAAWDFYIDSTDEKQKNFEIAQMEYDGLFKDKETFKFLDELKTSGNVKNKVLKKQLKDLHRVFEDYSTGGEDIEKLDKKEIE